MSSRNEENYPLVKQRLLRCQQHDVLCESVWTTRGAGATVLRQTTPMQVRYVPDDAPRALAQAIFNVDDMTPLMEGKVIPDACRK